MKSTSSLYCIVLVLCVTILFSCGSDDPTSPYPKNVSIEYKVTSTTSGLTADISYTNETGGDSDTGQVSLPYSKKFTDRVEFAEIITLSALTDDPGMIKLEIIIDNKVVETQTFESASFVVGTILHQFN